MTRWSAWALLFLGLAWWSGAAGAQESAAKSGASTPKAAAGDGIERGQLVPKPTRFGGYFQYLPKREAVGVLVVAHGQPPRADVQEIRGLAKAFAGRWVDLAERHGLILVAPTFDDVNFDSVSGNQGGGYRALYGRQVMADDYVHEMVDRYKGVVAGGWDGRIWLYGHSAGGQFASRYAAKNPGRLRGLVITAAGQYAMPDPRVEWPNGMAAVDRTIRWGPGRTPQRITARPDPADWLRAAQVPTTVIVGALDTEPQSARAGHASLLRTDRARQWVEAMNRLAAQEKKQGRLQLVVVPGVAHDSAKLTPAALQAMGDLMGQP